ncbi:polyadenylate-binding protein RBP45A-like [Triticum dicoccoides]|uniref:polyadenylate-binding protein RBP45A-like n=1 Tax=Triticum dicoccoides TaxID=85692 RepID=UPI00189063C4|nr:polyadenylate-binding protein RBP45A-like [Triticum dicoccoides]
MAHPPPRNWAMAPPYHYHGTSQQEQAAPAAEDESGAGSGGQEAESRSLRIRELFPWMDEDYLRSCFTRSPERSRVWMFLTIHSISADFRTQGTYSDSNQNNSRLFVGQLDSCVTDEDLDKAFSPFGELTVKVIEGKNYGFVTYSSRASAVEAMTILNGSQLGDNIITVNWARPTPKKQDQWNGVDYGHPQSSGPGYGCCPEDPNILGYTGHPGYAYHQQQQPQQTSVQ